MHNRSFAWALALLAVTSGGCTYLLGLEGFEEAEGTGGQGASGSTSTNGPGPGGGGSGGTGGAGPGSGGGPSCSGDCVVDLPGATWAIVADQEANVYWTHESGMNSGVLTLPMSEPYLVEGTGSTSNSPFGLHVIDTEVYWSAVMNGIWMATLDGATEPGTPYGPADSTAFAISSDNDYVYWTDRALNAVRRARRKTGADLASIATAGVANPGGLVVTGGFAYWVNQGTGSVMKVDPSNVANLPITIATVAGSATGIDVKDGFVYWTIENGGPAGGGAVMRARDEMESDEVTAIAINQNNPSGIVVDADKSMVYWVNSGETGMSNGAVMSAPVDSENSEGATALRDGQARPTALALTPTEIYWVNSGDGTVNRMPKPQ